MDIINDRRALHRIPEVDNCLPKTMEYILSRLSGLGCQVFSPAYAFNTAALEDIAQRAARAIGLEIYGGDAIITPQGDIYIIDINDFPSFTAVREAAAAEIAALIMSKKPI